MELERLSLTDGLTGICNRRMFDQRLETEWNDSKRHRKPLSLIILDIDYFKQYNDLYGHVGGDECLRSLAVALNATARRPRDVVARFGGEEFALLLPETDKVMARKLAQECAEGIGRLQIPHKNSSVSQFVTASIGVKTTVPAGDTTPREFVEEVDRNALCGKG